MVIDHIGIVVKSIEEGVRLWKDMFGYEQVTGPVINTRQKVKVTFLKKPNSIDIKLIEPTSDSSSVFQLSRRGGGLHHICFQCEDLHRGLEQLTAKGARILTMPEPGEAFGNENISFIFAGQGLNIELIDTNKRANQLS